MRVTNWVFIIKLDSVLTTHVAELTGSMYTMTVANTFHSRCSIEQEGVALL